MSSKLTLKQRLLILKKLNIVEYIDLNINGKDFIIINFPKNSVVEQSEGDVIYKGQGQISYEILPKHKKGYIKLISKISELDVEKIFNEISPYNVNQISGKRFLDSFFNIKKITIDENLKELKEYKFLDNPYIFKLIKKQH